MKWISRLYIFFVGIILTTTVGFGIAAFYPEPVRPAYPTTYSPSLVPQSCYATPENQKTPECQTALNNEKEAQTMSLEKQKEYEAQNQRYSNTSAGYSRTAIFLGISIGAFFAILGLALIKLSHPVSNGIILAGVLTAVFTRLIIMLASFGSSVTGTSSPDSLSYIEFGILAMLSLAVIVVGFTTLKSSEPMN